MGSFLPPRPILVGKLQPNVQRRLVPPPRPPPPNFNRRGASSESPASPDGSEPYSLTDSPTKQTAPSPPPYSPNRLQCDRSLYVTRQDYQFALPMDCPDDRPPRTPEPFSVANPPLQPAPELHARIRRRAPPPPRSVGRGADRREPYARPPIPSEKSAFVRPRPLPFGRARNLFADFIPIIESPPSPPPMVRTFPGPPKTPSTPLRPPS